MLALGSNLGDRLGNLARGLAVLARELDVEAVSSVYASPPEGGGDQPEFLNAVAVARTGLSPREVLGLAHRVEDTLGRERPFRNAPRTLDVDLVFHGDRVLGEADLVVPHPRWAERAFVLAPLAEVAPDLVPPGDGRSVGRVWADARPHLPPARRIAGPDVIAKELP